MKELKEMFEDYGLDKEEKMSLILSNFETKVLYCNYIINSLLILKILKVLDINFKEIKKKGD